MMRVARSELRSWCSIAQTHQDEDDRECGWRHGFQGLGHRLRLRRMLVCSVKECGQAYFTKEEFDEHKCCDAY